MKKILILGANGMLGSMLKEYFSSREGYEVAFTTRKKERGIYLDAKSSGDELLGNLAKANDYIINAIGVIKPYCNGGTSQEVRNAILVNSDFPHRLRDASHKNDCKVIQIATDCVYDGKTGGYTEKSIHNAEDVYGKTKSLGEAEGILNIRCSIVGPEEENKVSLLEWFLAQEKKVYGFSHHKWNGVTTLRFAKIVDEVIQNGLYDSLLEKSSIYHFVPKYLLTKKEMLEIFSRVYEKDIEIEPKDESYCPSIDRSIGTIYNEFEEMTNIDFEKDLVEMREFWKN